MTEIAEETGLSIIASGGVGSIEDCEKIFNASSRRIEGVITGRALYEDKLNLKTAIEKFQTEET
jgi:phosphoribosylformimino-5-aminoimidazole carboxamide ribotide isomerase